MPRRPSPAWGGWALIRRGSMRRAGRSPRGHPIGASGAVLAVRAFHRLQATGGRALVAIAGAGGIASAMVVSRQDETLRPWQD
ncbi:hypothetical protein [Xanthobacter autotrophicus]|uniref:hypothetical protein n=1 Tax=Xanthobacter autotrophicus TaxID=280 RepID=UPI003727365B